MTVTATVLPGCSTSLSPDAATSAAPVQGQCTTGTTWSATLSKAEPDEAGTGDTSPGTYLVATVTF